MERMRGVSDNAHTSAPRPLSDVRTIKGSADVTPDGLGGQGW